MGLSNDIPADVTAIERELQRQWQDQASGEPVVRTRTLNLLIVSQMDAIPPDLIAQLTEVHPCRAILVDLSSGVANFRAQVSSSCTVAHTGANCLAREEVRFRAPVQIESEKLESVIVPLLVPDLPIVLWWRGGPDVDNPLFTRLASHCGRIVVDSAESVDPWLGLAELHRAISDRRWPAAVTDLAWSRITAWRELTTQFFDNRQCAEYPAHIRAARIVYGNGAQLPSDAVLFAAWIARQLAWHMVDFATASPGKGHRLSLQRDGSPREIELMTHHGSARGLHAVQLTTTGDKEASFSIEQTLDAAGLVTTTRLGTQQVQRTVRSRRLNLAKMLGCEISSVSRDTLYEQVLGVVREMLGAAK